MGIRVSNFYNFLSVHFHYKPSEEVEIRGNILNNKNAYKIETIVSIFKNNNFKTKLKIKQVTISTKVYLKIDMVYFDEIPEELIQKLTKDLNEELKETNIFLESERITKEEFEQMRCKPLGL